jgi:hypothetical protein
LLREYYQGIRPAWLCNSVRMVRVIALEVGDLDVLSADLWRRQPMAF